MVNSIGSGSGNASGIFDIKDVIDNLTIRQQNQIALLQKGIQSQQNHLTLYNNLKSFLINTFQKSVTSLSDAFNVLSFQAKSSNSNAISATISTNKNVYPGTHTINVTSLAKAESIGSSNFFSDKSVALNANETLNFAVGAKNFSLAIAPTDSLEKIRDNINMSNDNNGITASILTTNAPDGSVENRIVISSVLTGVANKVTISGDTDNIFDFSNQMSTAADATFKFDGLDVIRSSNSITDVIDGLSFNLLSTNEGQNVTIDVSNSEQDRNAAITTAFTNLIDSYNKLFQFVDQSQASKDNRDATLPSIKVMVKNAANFASFLNFGVSIDPITKKTAADGSSYISTDGLIINSDKLSSAIANNFAEFKAAITDSTTGVVAHLTKAITDLNVPIEYKTTEINQEISYIGHKIDKQMTLLETIKDSIMKKYSAANEIISKLEATQKFLDLQLSSFKNNNK